MKPETYNALLKDLQKLQKTLVASQTAAVRRDPELTARISRLHAEAEVGGRIDDFVAMTARKSTVLFLLRSVFVRVLEDLGILSLKRIRGDWGFAAFREIAPALDHRAYFGFVFRDLAVDFPALFSPGHDELPLPDEDGCVEVWDLWHHPNRQGEHYIWNGDDFDSRFLGDLYQDLDADIRKRFALLQTPRFVEEYILDHTLTPALLEFDPASLRGKSEVFRLIDPTCGSGHFLIGSFQRLVSYWRDRHGLDEWSACERALESVWGCDINPHAIDIAAFRLLLEVVAQTGVKDLDRLASLNLNLRALDSLIPWERGSRQRDLFPTHDRLNAYATKEQRSANAVFLSREFHAVVGNPPYIQPKDSGKSDDYRAFWPDSCFKEYCLNAPFLERFFVLGAKDAFTGQITANNFAKRSFGKSVVAKVLSKWRTTAVVDTSLAPIPGHGWRGGTSTVILFGRSSPFEDGMIPWVLAKRRESADIEDPSTSQAWTSIKCADLTVDQQGVYVDVQLRPADKVAVWPWDLRGQDAQEVVNVMERSTAGRLVDLCEGRIGSDVITRAPDLFEWTPQDGERFGLPHSLMRPYADGKDIRDWYTDFSGCLLVPYSDRAPVEGADRDVVIRLLWHWRRKLAGRFVSGGVTLADKKLPFFVLPQVPWHKHETSRNIAFPFVTTEPHFALVEQDAWFKDSVKLIRIRRNEPRDTWLYVAGLLNTSAASYWLRGRFKGTGNVRELWEERIQIDEQIGKFPIGDVHRKLVASLASELIRHGEQRAACSPGALISSEQWSAETLGDDIDAAKRRHQNATHRMVALQEELDWCAYAVYGLADGLAIAGVDEIEPMPPGHRPFEVVLARTDEGAADDEKTSWWVRHNHERVLEVVGAYSPGHHGRLLARVGRIESDARVALLESPSYKRRWENIDWEAECRRASESWLLDRLEDLFRPATDNRRAGLLTAPRPYRLEEIVGALSRDARAEAVAGVWSGTGLSVDLTLVVEELLRDASLPDNPRRLYSDEGILKYVEWNRWGRHVQDSETADGVAGKSGVVLAISKPPEFVADDFADERYFSQRGSVNVPRERFIVFADLSPPRFGWNGWHDRDRALAQVEAYTLAENDPQHPLPVPTIDDPRRCGVTLGLWESLPAVELWGGADEHAELQSLAQEACRQSRCPCPVVDAWRAQVLSGGGTDDTALVMLSNDKGTSRSRKSGKIQAPPEVGPESAVSLTERAWIAGLLETAEHVDLAGIWALHRRRVGDPATTPGATTSGGQLRFAEVDTALPKEARDLDEARLAIVVDDLVASGDLAVRGRGKKKRYQLVPRASRV